MTRKRANNIGYFIFFALLFLFYPGNGKLYNIYAYNDRLFAPPPTDRTISIAPYPITSNAPPPVTSSREVMIADRTTLTPVYMQNATILAYPASTSKIITALVAFDNYKPDDVVTIKRVLEEGQIMELVPGERISVENLMYGILVHSGNDAAYALADHMGYEKFITKMNEKAMELNMTKTHFENPAGLHDPRQVTTAFDLAIAGRALLDNTYLAKISSTKQITVSDVDYKYFHPLYNVNQLLGEIQGVGGLKTGYTEEAGENLITLYKRPDGREMIIVVLGSEDRFTDTKTIVDWINLNVQFSEEITVQ